MYDRILFPTDGSDGASAVFDGVLDVAERHDATVHVLNVVDTTHDTVTRVGSEVVEALEQRGERVVADAAARASDRGVATVTDVVAGAVPATITNYAAEHDVDLVAVSTHGRTGMERVLLGSVAERVVRGSPVPVLVLRPDGEDLAYPHGDVLVPTDGSDLAAAALDHAAELVDGGTLHVISVVDVASLGLDVHSQVQVKALEDDAADTVAAATAAAEDAGVESVVGDVAVRSSVDGAIHDYAADHDVGLIVMGTHGRSGLDRYLLGSVAEKTVRTASTPVLTVPERETDGE